MNNKRKIIPPQMRYMVLAKCYDKCAYCGSDINLKTMQIDHYWPVCNGYKLHAMHGIDVHDLRNLLPSCRTCNHYKRDRTPEEFRALLSGLFDKVKKIYLNKVAQNYGLVYFTNKPISFHFENPDNIYAELPYTIPSV